MMAMTVVTEITDSEDMNDSVCGDDSEGSDDTVHGDDSDHVDYNDDGNDNDDDDALTEACTTQTGYTKRCAYCSMCSSLQILPSQVFSEGLLESRKEFSELLHAFGFECMYIRIDVCVRTCK